MELKGRPDAIFCAGDYAAPGVLLAAMHSGIDVPGERGLSGFGNEPFTAFREDK